MSQKIINRIFKNEGGRDYSEEWQERVPATAPELPCVIEKTGGLSLKKSLF
jgi:hypothetical protein